MNFLRIKHGSKRCEIRRDGENKKNAMVLELQLPLPAGERTIDLIDWLSRAEMCDNLAPEARLKSDTRERLDVYHTSVTPSLQN